MLLSSTEIPTDAGVFAEDIDRLNSMPKQLVDELRAYVEDLLAGIERDDKACIWLDHESRRCRHHEYRPSICRDFAVGSEDCLVWRVTYDIG